MKIYIMETDTLEMLAMETHAMRLYPNNLLFLNSLHPNSDKNPVYPAHPKNRVQKSTYNFSKIVL